MEGDRGLHPRTQRDITLIFLAQCPICLPEGLAQQADEEWDIRWLGVAFAAVGLPGKDGSQEAERWRCRFQRDYGQSLLLVLGLIVAGLSDQQRGNEAQSSQKATEEKALLESLQGIGTDPLE